MEYLQWEGTHAKYWGKGNSEKLGSEELLKEFLSKVVDVVGMRVLSGPHMSNVELDIAKMGKEPFEDEGGITGIVVLSTSHCAIHTWPLRETFVMDIYSCREFQPEVVKPLLEVILGCEKLYITDLKITGGDHGTIEK
jgi:S-adenosylmethionine decarboxylase